MTLAPLPDSLPPSLWCDFNACGWSGCATDNCYYVFDEQALAALRPGPGQEVFLFMEDDAVGILVVGCIALLEPYLGS